jgi:CRP/FNR family cyclic AMP-dependent transcriptional regulator
VTYADNSSVFDPQIFLSVAGAGRTFSKIPADTVIFAQGDPARAVYFLQGGNIDVTVTSQTGKEAVLAILGPGDFFGEGCLNGETLQRSTVTALTDCAIVQVEKSAMVDTLNQEPKFTGLFLSQILASNRVC